MVALAVLAPIVASQGENAATQTMTVAVRALATRELGSHNASRRDPRRHGRARQRHRVRRHRRRRGGLVLYSAGLVIGVCDHLHPLCRGALGGILIPIVLERVRADPGRIISGTFVTTVTDVVGFFSFLGIATLVRAEIARVQYNGFYR